MFAVTGEKKVEAETAAAATPTPTTAVATATPKAPATTTGPTASPATASEVPGFEMIFAVVALLIVYTTVLRKNRERGGE